MAPTPKGLGSVELSSDSQSLPPVKAPDPRLLLLIHLRNKTPPHHHYILSFSLTHTHTSHYPSITPDWRRGLGRMWDQLVISSDKETCWMCWCIRKSLRAHTAASSWTPVLKLSKHCDITWSCLKRAALIFKNDFCLSHGCSPLKQRCGGGAITATSSGNLQFWGRYEDKTFTLCEYFPLPLTYQRRKEEGRGVKKSRVGGTTWL